MKKALLTLAGVGLTTTLVFAQQQTVRGTVVSSEDGQPVIGATVVVKGKTTIGAATDVDGKFTLNVPKDAKTLIISYVGYKTQEIAVGNNLKISLEPDSKLVDEVLVVAFGTAKKSAFTGSAVQIGSKELSKLQVSNITQAFTGKVAGLRASSGNNQPGTAATLSIRGVGSFSAGTGPLYVVDGVPYNGDISAINPADIESTSVLKDAASAALYGARGANGVILITTKTGSRNRDRMNITFEARYGVNSRAVGDYDVIKDPRVYAAKYFEALYNNNIQAKGATEATAYAKTVEDYFSTDPKATNLVYHPFTFQDRTKPFIRQNNGSFVMAPDATLGAMYTGTDKNNYWLTPDDWADVIFENNPRQEYNLSISGASNKATYFLSAGYLSDEGYAIGSDYERLTARLRSDFTPYEWLKMGANIGITNTTYQRLSNTDEGGNSGNIFALTNYIAPIYPVYVRSEDKNILIDKWGNQVHDFGNGTYPGLTRPYLSIANPVAVNSLDVKNNKVDASTTRAYIDIMPIKGLKFTANIGYDASNLYYTGVSNVFYGQMASQGGSVNKEMQRSRSFNAQQLLNYRTTIAGKHNVEALLGHEYYNTRSEYFYGSKINMYAPDNTEINGAIATPRVGSYRTQYATEGYLGRLMYDYDNKYFFQASYRRDASSRFLKSNRWGNFWSLGASWLISKEDFMASASSWVDMLKVKLSYGVQGNDDVGSFRYQDIYSLSNANDMLAVAFKTKGNENLTWETSYNLNGGVEFSFFKERLTGNFEVYSREVTDMLFWRTVARSAGYSGYYDNIGAMRNTGFDLELRGKILKTKDLSLGLYTNAGMFVNKLTKLPEEWTSIEGGYLDDSKLYRVGGSIYDRMYAKYLGVNDKGQSTWQTYDKDKNEYGVTTDPTVAQERANRVVYDDLAPKLTGGFGIEFEYKGIDFSAGFSYALGGRVMDGTYQNLMHGGAGGSTGTNWHKDILNSWTPENKTSNIPMVNFGGKFFNSTSDRFLTSRDYLSLDNITLGYTLKGEWLKRLHLSNVRIYAVADNVMLLSARKGFDPRFGGGVGYKAIRTVSGGIRVTF